MSNMKKIKRILDIPSEHEVFRHPKHKHLSNKGVDAHICDINIKKELYNIKTVTEKRVYKNCCVYTTRRFVDGFDYKLNSKYFKYNK